MYRLIRRIPLAAQSQWKVPSTGKALFGLALALAMILGMLTLYSFSGVSNLKDLNYNVPSSVDQVGRALMKYSRQAAGRYPTSVEEANRILLSPGAGLLENDTLRPTRWGTQARLLPICPELAENFEAKRGMTFARADDSKTIVSCNQPGAIIYIPDPTGRHFKLVGIGLGNPEASMLPFWAHLLPADALYHLRIRFVAVATIRDDQTF